MDSKQVYTLQTCVSEGKHLFTQPLLAAYEEINERLRLHCLRDVDFCYHETKGSEILKEYAIWKIPLSLLYDVNFRNNPDSYTQSLSSVSSYKIQTLLCTSSGIMSRNFQIVFIRKRLHPDGPIRVTHPQITLSLKAYPQIMENQNGQIHI